MQNKVFLSLFLISAYLNSNPASANTAIIQELEKLRNTISIKDASRGELTLRLADLYFNEANNKIKDANLHPSSTDYDKLYAEAEKNRMRALSLYKEGLEGKEKTTRVKILFQMAQIYHELGKKSEAKTYWQELSQQDQIPQIKAEALLRLAQSLEETSNLADSKQAEKNYRLALQYCNERDICSFIHYRLAWILKSRNDYTNALVELQESLWDSRGNIQEEVLRDYLVFLAEGVNDVNKSLALVDPLAIKLNRPELVFQLAENYYSNGNKAAGTYALRLMNDRKPKLSNEIRLLEEYYGLRQWEDFQNILSLLNERLSKNTVLPADEVENSEKILRRLVIQLDAERISQSQHTSSFQDAAMIYLKLYPKTDSSFRIMESWLNAENNLDKKKKQTQDWLAQANSTFQLTENQGLRLHELLAELAQKTKDTDLLLKEMKELENLYKNPDKKRSSQYVYARTLYENKKYDSALPLFQNLASLLPNQSPDQWAILSQNLALDILNQQKDFTSIRKQASLWLNNPIAKNKTLQKEMEEMQKVSSAAEFEQAVAQGNTKEALQTFFQNCKLKQFLPKSCDNAKSVALALHDQKMIIAILELENKNSELVSFYELAGYFGKAAVLLEKETPLESKKWQPSAAYKIALLYELDGNIKDRNRWLQAITAYYKKNKGLEKEEGLFWQTMLDANLVSPALLDLPWSLAKKQEIAAYFENRGNSTAATKNILLNSTASLGKAWTNYILQEVTILDKAQRKISFYGKNSKAKFQNRIAKLAQLEKYINHYLEGADRETRILLLLTMIQANIDLSNELLATPLPDGIDEATAAQVKISLSELAKPFLEKQQNYTTICLEQISKFESNDLKAKYAALLNEKNAQALAKEFLAWQINKATASGTNTKTWEYSAINSLLEALRANSQEEPALQGLKDYFNNKDQKRLASYFEGRIRQLKKESI